MSSPSNKKAKAASVIRAGVDYIDQLPNAKRTSINVLSGWAGERERLITQKQQLEESLKKKKKDIEDLRKDGNSEARELLVQTRILSEKLSEAGTERSTLERELKDLCEKVGKQKGADWDPEKEYQERQAKAKKAAGEPPRKRSTSGASPSSLDTLAVPGVTPQMLSPVENKRHSAWGLRNLLKRSGSNDASGASTQSAASPKASRRDDKKAPKKLAKERTVKEIPEIDPEQVKTIEDLPPKVQKKIHKCRVPLELANENWSLFLTILRFRKQVTWHKQHSELFAKPYDPELAATLIQEAPKKLMKMKNELGSGGFGRVFESKLGKENVAIKVMGHVKDKERRLNLHEIAIMNKISHPSIVNFKCSYQVGEECWLLMELMEGGTLKEASKLHEFTEKEIAFVSFELLKGIKYLHELKLAHRDLKSVNIMMTVTGQMKIIDFGLCADMSDGPRTEMLGSPYWIPPEMIRVQPHSYPVDVWSFAVSLLELCNGEFFFNNSSPLRALLEAGTIGIKEPFHNPSKWSDTFKDFVSCCLRIEQEERATPAFLLEHKFLTKKCKKDQVANILSSIFVNNAVESMLLM